ncbi:hypothetical protein EQP49_05030 [Yersinia sp. 2105 StPb PI]|nr:hypothetical protein EQP49_05030 [Yersinia sp. 2105 StPb PI]
MAGDSICFFVPNTDDYQPANIAINSRDTPHREQNITFDPGLRVTDGKLCIPPSFYSFPDKGQFIVGYVLTSKAHGNVPRRIVAGIEISNGRVYGISLTDREAAR